MKKITKYIDNVNKSIKFVVFDKIKEDIPALTSIGESARDLYVEVNNAIKGSKSNNFIMKNKSVFFGKDNIFKFTLKNIKDDILSGKFYNESRKRKYEELSMKDIMGDIDEFDFGDFDFGDEEFDIEDFDISDGEEAIVKSIEATSAASASTISRMISSSISENIKNSRDIANRQMLVYGKYAEEIGRGISVTNDNIIQVGNKLTEVSQATKGIFENSKTFYEKASLSLDEIKALLQEQVEINRTIYQDYLEKEEDGPGKPTFKTIYDGFGGIDAQEYLKNIKLNIVSAIDDVTMGAASMVKDMMSGDDGEVNIKSMLQEALSSPISSMMKMALNAFTKGGINKSASLLNETLENLIPNIFARLNLTANDENAGPFANILAKIFRVKSPTKVSVSNEYKKGPVPWDGKSKRSLEVVIPGLLSKIYSAVSGKEQLVYDFEEDVFKDTSTIGKEFDDKVDDYISSATSKITNKFEKILDNMNMSMESRSKIDESITKWSEYLFKTGEIFSPSNKYQREMMGIDQREFDIIANMFLSLSRQDQMGLAKRILEGRQDLSRFIDDQSKSGDSIYGLDGVYGIDSKYMGTRKDPDDIENKFSNFGKTDNWYLLPRDKDGNNYLDYLRHIVIEMKSGLLIRGQSEEPQRQLATPNGLLIGQSNSLLNPEYKQYLDYMEAVRREQRLEYNKVYNNSQDEDSDNKVNLDQAKGNLRSEIYSTAMKLGVNVPEYYDEDLDYGNIISDIAGNSLGGKFQVVADKIETIKQFINKPKDMIKGFLDQVDLRLYEVIFGADSRIYKGQEVKGFMDVLIINAKEVMNDFSTWMHENVFDKIAEGLGKFGEGFVDTLEDFTGIDLRAIARSTIKNKLIGDLDPDTGERRGGVFSGTYNELNRYTAEFKEFIVGPNMAIIKILNEVDKFVLRSGRMDQVPDWVSVASLYETIKTTAQMMRPRGQEDNNLRNSILEICRNVNMDKVESIVQAISLILIEIQDSNLDKRGESVIYKFKQFVNYIKGSISGEEFDEDYWEEGPESAIDIMAKLASVDIKNTINIEKFVRGEYVEVDQILLSQLVKLFSTYANQPDKGIDKQMQLIRDIIDVIDSAGIKSKADGILVQSIRNAIDINSAQASLVKISRIISRYCKDDLKTIMLVASKSLEGDDNDTSNQFDKKEHTEMIQKGIETINKNILKGIEYSNIESYDEDLGYHTFGQELLPSDEESRNKLNLSDKDLLSLKKSINMKSIVSDIEETTLTSKSVKKIQSALSKHKDNLSEEFLNRLKDTSNIVELYKALAEFDVVKDDNSILNSLEALQKKSTDNEITIENLFNKFKDGSFRTGIDVVNRDTIKEKLKDKFGYKGNGKSWDDDSLKERNDAAIDILSERMFDGSHKVGIDNVQIFDSRFTKFKNKVKSLMPEKKEKIKSGDNFLRDKLMEISDNNEDNFLGKKIKSTIGEYYDLKDEVAKEKQRRKDLAFRQKAKRGITNIPVNRDGRYVGELHEGERVLTKGENTSLVDTIAGRMVDLTNDSINQSEMLSKIWEIVKHKGFGTDEAYNKNIRQLLALYDGNNESRIVERIRNKEYTTKEEKKKLAEKYGFDENYTFKGEHRGWKEGTKELFSDIKNAIIGESDNKDKIEGLFSQIGNLFKDKNARQKAFSSGTAAGLIGGLGGGILGLAGGPLLWGGIGAAAGIIESNDNLKNYLFGEFGEDGKRTGGALFGKELMGTINKYVPDMSKYGVAGGIAGLMPFIPGGPVAGLLIGTGIGFAKHNEKIQEALFGEDNGIFDPKTKEKIEEAVPRGIVGAIAGLGIKSIGLSPFGLVPTIALGSVLSMSRDNDSFRDFLFGEKDDNGERHGGLLGVFRDKITRPVVGWFKKGVKETGEAAKEALTGVFKVLGQPMIESVKNTFNSIKEKVNDVFDGIERWFRKKHPVIDKIFDTIKNSKIYKMLTENSLTKFIKSLFNPFTYVKGAFKTVGGVSKFFGGRLRGRHIKRELEEGGDFASRYMTAKEKYEYASKFYNRYRFTNEQMEELKRQVDEEDVIYNRNAENAVDKIVSEDEKSKEEYKNITVNDALKDERSLTIKKIRFMDSVIELLTSIRDRKSPMGDSAPGEENKDNKTNENISPDGSTNYDPTAGGENEDEEAEQEEPKVTKKIVKGDDIGEFSRLKNALSSKFGGIGKSIKDKLGLFDNSRDNNLEEGIDKVKDNDGNVGYNITDMGAVPLVEKNGEVIPDKRSKVGRRVAREEAREDIEQTGMAQDINRMANAIDNVSGAAAAQGKGGDGAPVSFGGGLLGTMASMLFGGGGLKGVWQTIKGAPGKIGKFGKNLFTGQYANKMTPLASIPFLLFPFLGKLFGLKDGGDNALAKFFDKGAKASDTVIEEMGGDADRVRGNLVLNHIKNQRPTKVLQKASEKILPNIHKFTDSKIGEILISKAGKIFSSPRIERLLSKDICQKIIKTFPRIVQSIGKGSLASLGSFAAKLAVPIEIGLIAWDLGTGAYETDRIIEGIDIDTDPGMRLCTATCKAISNRLLLGLVTPTMIFNFIGKFFMSDKQMEKINQGREKLNKMTDAYNTKYGIKVSKSEVNKHYNKSFYEKYISSKESQVQKNLRFKSYDKIIDKLREKFGIEATQEMIENYMSRKDNLIFRRNKLENAILEQNPDLSRGYVRAALKEIGFEDAHKDRAKEVAKERYAMIKTQLGRDPKLTEDQFVDIVTTNPGNYTLTDSIKNGGTTDYILQALQRGTKEAKYKEGVDEIKALSKNAFDYIDETSDNVAFEHKTVGLKQTDKKYNDLIDNSENYVSNYEEDLQDTGTGGRSIPFMSQLNSRWKNQGFNTSFDTINQTLGDSGCGPTTAAMVLSYLTGGIITPDYMGKLISTIGKEKDGGTPYTSLAKAGLLFGFNPTISNSLSSDMLMKLRHGMSPLILQGKSNIKTANSPFGKNQHYVVATGIDKDGKLMINDPLSNSPKSFDINKTMMNVNKVVDFGSSIFGRGTTELSPAPKNASASRKLLSANIMTEENKLNKDKTKLEAKHGMGIELKPNKNASMAENKNKQLDISHEEFYTKLIEIIGDIRDNTEVLENINKMLFKFFGIDIDKLMKSNKTRMPLRGHSPNVPDTSMQTSNIYNMINRIVKA